MKTFKKLRVELLELYGDRYTNISTMSPEQRKKYEEEQMFKAKFGKTNRRDLNILDRRQNEMPVEIDNRKNSIDRRVNKR